MARLPIPGSDDGSWGDILNRYLLISHTSGGAIRPSALPEASSVERGMVKLAGDLAGTADAPSIPALANKYEKPITGIPETDLEVTAQAKLNAVPPVTSVATKTGDITLDKTDVGLANVDNTSDADKPISTAAQTAFDNKVDLIDPRLSDERVPLDGSVDNSKIAPGAAIAQSKIASLTTDLAAKYVLPAGGIPETDMASSVRTKLNASPPVTSVNTRTGDVTLTKTDVGLSNVENVKVLTVPVGTAVPAGTPDGTLFVEYTP